MKPVIEKLCGNFKLGEAPHWDDASQMLYFVDINGHTINRYVPATKKHTSAYIGKSNYYAFIMWSTQKNLTNSQNRHMLKLMRLSATFL